MPNWRKNWSHKDYFRKILSQHKQEKRVDHSCTASQRASRRSSNGFVPEFLYLTAAFLFLVQYIGKQKHEKLYMQDQLHQTLRITLISRYRKYIRDLIIYDAIARRRVTKTKQIFIEDNNCE